MRAPGLSKSPPSPPLVVPVRQPPVTAVFEMDGGVPGVLAVLQPVGEVMPTKGPRPADDVADGERVGPVQMFDDVVDVALLFGAHGVGHLVERLRARRRRLGIEAAEVERREIVGDRLSAARIEARPVSRPVSLVEGAPLNDRPSDEMAAVVGWQEDAADLMVGGDDHPNNVHHVVGRHVFRVDSERVGRR